MATWVGALVETKGRAELAAVLAAHGVTLEGSPGPWVLVQVDGGVIAPPGFAPHVSRALGGRVIAFAAQTAASVEALQAWDDGALVRALTYSGDEGGWIEQQGTPQDWEGAYFFADREGTREGEAWPLALDDEISDEDLSRFEQARAAKDASTVMDLLHAGSAHGLRRLCAHFGVDPQRPGARVVVPASWKPRLVVAAIVVFLVGMSLLGALTHR